MSKQKNASSNIQKELVSQNERMQQRLAERKRVRSLSNSRGSQNQDMSLSPSYLQKTTQDNWETTSVNSLGSITSAQGAHSAAQKLFDVILRVCFTSQQRTLTEQDEELQELSCYLCEMNVIDQLTLKQTTTSRVLSLIAQNVKDQDLESKVKDA